MAAPDLKAALEAGLSRLEAQLDRLRQSPGVEAVHDARVAARRLRAVLRGVEAQLNPVLAQQIEFELRAIGRTLAPLRDADVCRAVLVPVLRSLLRADPELAGHAAAGVDAFVALLDAERARERQALRTTVRSAAWAARRQRLGALVASEALVLPGRDGIDAVLAPQIERRWRRLQREVQRDLQDTRRLHRVRIHAKVARYQLEQWLSATGRPGLDALDLARRLQNVCGDLHDLVLLRGWLQNAAVPPAAMAAWLHRAALQEGALRRRVRKLAREARKTPAGLTGTG